ncbi:MAG: hypothetical protein ACT4OM_00600, partial [Actinomycetota bacterium]
MAAMVLMPIPSALAGVAVSAAPTFPSSINVGGGPEPVSLTLRNGSTFPNADENILLSNIRLTPGCGASSGFPCATPDVTPTPIFMLSGTGTGGAGTACAGTTFTISAPDSIGRVTFTPSVPVVLGPLSGPANLRDCIINFTILRVNRVPAIDSNAALAGLQTRVLGEVNAVGQATGNDGEGTGSQTVTVTQGNLSLSTVASADIALGGQVTDTATLAGNAGNPPTGIITFTLFGPDNADCS